jgi:hypothetical protein
LVEITAFRLQRIFQPMRELELITGHMVYNPAYNQILKMKDTINDFQNRIERGLRR